jgi:hypothetical protein
MAASPAVATESFGELGLVRGAAPHVPGREATSALAFYVRFLCAPRSSFSTSYLASFRKSISS